MAVDVDTLVASNLDLVKEIAHKRFAGRRGDDDLIQMGNIGLWEAAQRWDGSGNFRKYAYICVYHNMIDYVRKPSRLMGEWPMTDEDGEEYIYDDDLAIMDLMWTIDKAWPRDTPENKVLTLLAAGYNRRETAAQMGLDVRQVIRLAKKAVRPLELGGKKKPVGE